MEDQSESTVSQLFQALKIIVDHEKAQKASRAKQLTERLPSRFSHAVDLRGIEEIPDAPLSPSLSTKRAQAVRQDVVDYPTIPSAGKNPAVPATSNRPQDTNMDDDNMDEIDAKNAIRSSSHLFGFVPGFNASPRATRHLDGTPIEPSPTKPNRSGQEMPPPNPRIPSAAMSATTDVSYKSARTSFINEMPPTLAHTSFNTSFGTNANSSFSTNANKSFGTTANTSFWSEPAGSPPQSSATTAYSSMCLDGANDIIPTQQSSAYGEFPTGINSSQLHALERNLEKAVEPPSSNYEQGTTLSQMDYSTPHHELKAGQRDDDTVDTSPHTPQKTPMKPDMLETPFKISYLRTKLIGNGLAPIRLPSFAAVLPFNVQFEAARVLQSGKVSEEKLERDWPRPRTMDSLYAVDPSLERLRVSGFDDESSDFSLSAKLIPGANPRDARPLELHLSPPVRQKRNEFERAHGASRVLVVEFAPCKLEQLSVDEVKDAVQYMIGNDNTLFGRNWIEFFTREKKRKNATIKPGTVEFHLFATHGPGLEYVTIIDFLDDLLPFRENAHQPSGKLYARLEIKASRTDDGPVFRKDQIEVVDDILATDVDDDAQFNDPLLQFDNTFDENNRAVMTDGCGQITPKAMRMLWDSAGGEGPLPCTVQGRFAGAKGMWMLREPKPLFSKEDLSSPAKLISVTKSQMKIIQKSTTDEFAFRVLRFPSPPKASLLYAGFLPILYNRSGPHAMQRICRYIELQVRAFIESYEEAMNSPLTFRKWMSIQSEIGRTADRRLDIETIAGFPTARFERIIQMLEAGFEPRKCKYLASEIYMMMYIMLTIKGKNFKIPCPRSTVVVGLPDWTATLKPGEVHLAFSQPFKDHTDDTFHTTWKGLNCLVARNPARRISDIQKLKIVRKPKLEHIVDVAVFSTKGRHPEAGKLQGGDYDGDTFWICIEPELVENFRNAAAPTELPSPSELCLEKDSTTFSELVTIPSDANTPFSEAQLKDWLARNRLKRMEMNLLGRMTLLQEKLAYHYGIDSKQANITNDLCDWLIDAPKQCITMTDRGVSEFLKKNGIDKNLPEPAHRMYTSFVDDEKVTNGQKKVSDPRPDSINDVVHCTILEHEMKKARDVVERTTSENATVADDELTECYKKELEDAARGSPIYMELKALPNRLSDVVEKGKAIQSEYRKSFADGLACIQACRDLYNKVNPQDTSDGEIRGWTKPSGNETITKWDYLKASALFLKCCYTAEKVYLIPFRIAGDELCRLKAGKGPTRLMTIAAYRALKPANLLTYIPSKGSVVEEVGAMEDEDNDDRAGGVGVEGTRAQGDPELEDTAMSGIGDQRVDSPGPNVSVRRDRNRRAAAGMLTRAGDMIDLTDDLDFDGPEPKRRRESPKEGGTSPAKREREARKIFETTI